MMSSPRTRCAAVTSPAPSARRWSWFAGPIAPSLAILIGTSGGAAAWLAEAGAADCDHDGVIDRCAIASGAAPDCNGNGVPDSCDIPPSKVLLESPPLGPFGAGLPASWTFLAPPTPATSVLLTFQCKADLGASDEFVTVSLNGVGLGDVFVSAASGCATPFSEAAVLVAPAAFLAATGGGDAMVQMVASSEVAADACPKASFIKVALSYQTVPSNDLDQDGVPDECEVGDLDGDAFVDAADLGLLLAAWGPCGTRDSPCPADFDGDGVVDGADLGVLLTRWG